MTGDAARPFRPQRGESRGSACGGMQVVSFWVEGGVWVRSQSGLVDCSGFRITVGPISQRLA